MNFDFLIYTNILLKFKLDFLTKFLQTILKITYFDLLYFKLEDDNYRLLFKYI